jgi:hypothetical protein
MNIIKENKIPEQASFVEVPSLTELFLTVHGTPDLIKRSYPEDSSSRLPFRHTCVLCGQEFIGDNYRKVCALC